MDAVSFVQAFYRNAYIDEIIKSIQMAKVKV